MAVCAIAPMATGQDAPTSQPATQPATQSADATGTGPVAPPSGAEDRPVSSGSGRRVGESIIRTLVALAVVVALIFGLRVVMRRFGARSVAVGRSAPVNVLARTSVSPRQQLLVIRFGRRIVLVGSGPEGMAALAETRDADEVAEIVRQATGRAETPERAERASAREGDS